ncbi:MAG: DUF2184 domain-containing protein [Thiotrichales bacterium]|nr:DUF2184 domain-containing protein [Thiotrichales bacterium]
MDRLKSISPILASILANDGIADVNPADVASALVKVETEAYKVEYQDIVFHELFDVVNLNDTTATSFGYYYITEAGKAQLSNPDGKIAWIDSMLQMKQAPLHDGNVGYKYTLKELARVAKLKTALDSLKVETAIGATLELAQDICFDGDAKRDIVGFFNNLDVPSVSLIAGTGGNTWALKTSDEILADINHLFATAFATTKQIEFKIGSKTTRLMLPTALYSLIATKKMSEQSDKSILDYVVKNCPHLTDLKQVIPSAQIPADTMRIYQKDKRKIAFYWGHMINFKAPQPDDLNIKVPADFSIGGLVIRKPQSIWDMGGLS